MPCLHFSNKKQRGRERQGGPRNHAENFVSEMGGPRVVCELSEPNKKAKYAPPLVLHSRCWSSILWGWCVDFVVWQKLANFECGFPYDLVGTTNVQQLMCKMVWSFLLIFFLFSFKRKGRIFRESPGGKSVKKVKNSTPETILPLSFFSEWLLWKGQTPFWPFLVKGFLGQ